MQVRYQGIEKYSKSSQTSKMELSAKIVNRFKPLTIFAKSSISDYSQGSEDTSDIGAKWLNNKAVTQSSRRLIKLLCFLSTYYVETESGNLTLDGNPKYVIKNMLNVNKININLIIKK